MQRVFRLAGVLAPLAGCLVGGCGHATHHAPLGRTPAPDLEPRADEEAHANVRDGERVGEALHGAGYSDSGAEWRFPLEIGQCYAFGFAGDPGIQRLAFYLFDPRDKRVVTQRKRSAQGVFNHCAATNGYYRLEARVADGEGHFAVVVYRAASATPTPPPLGMQVGMQVEAPPPPPPSAPPPMAITEPESNLAGEIERQVAAVAPGASRVGDLYVGNGQSSEWYTAMDAGHCYWLIAAGDRARVRKLSVYLWDPRGKRITESRSDSDVAMVGHCATEPGMYRFSAKVERGAGQYKLGVFVK